MPWCAWTTSWKRRSPLLPVGATAGRLRAVVVVVVVVLVVGAPRADRDARAPPRDAPRDASPSRRGSAMGNG